MSITAKACQFLKYLGFGKLYFLKLAIGLSLLFYKDSTAKPLDAELLPSKYYLHKIRLIRFLQVVNALNEFKHWFGI